jgi:hypothetical protein
MQLLLATFVAFLANVSVLLALRRRYDADLYRVVALTYTATLLLRYALALNLWLYHTETSFSMTFWGDSRTYDLFGAALAESWENGGSIQSWSRTVEGQVNRGFIYCVAAVYYLFGRNVLLVQFLNGIIGAFTPIVILEIGLVLYGRRVATTAMLMTAFFPQMIFWSSALYKDPMVMFCIAVNILAVFRLRGRLSPTWVAIYLVTAGALVWLRFYLFYATAAATAAGMLFSRRRGMSFALASQLALVAGVLLLLLYTPVGQEALTQSRFFDLELLSNSRMDLARAGSGFAPTADVSTVDGVLSVLPMGVLHLLFAPFPWTVTSLRQALALPDILLWYALVPFLIRGVVSARNRLRETMPILVFTTALTLAYGAFLGNAGTAYRQRTQIMMFYFLFAADGIHSRGRREPAEATPEAP